MKARVKADSPWSTITAMAGRRFVKSEWSEVPEEFEDEAKRHPYLEVKGGSPTPEAEAEGEKAKATEAVAPSPKKKE